MYRILKAAEIAENIYLYDVEALRVARRCMPGQFVIVRAGDDGERIPLTICDYDRQKGSITLVVQVVGASTYAMRSLASGDSFTDVVGPLGKASDLCEMPIEELRKKHIVFIGGGLGTAPVYPQVKWLHEHGIDADVIIGARSQSLVILEEEMKAVAGNVYVTTDDGSYGRSGMVTKCLEDLIAEGKQYDHCVCIGPMIMMKFTCLTTKKYGIHTVVSLNPIMVDGTGMCGACRVTVGSKTMFACVDGPEFDGHLVDFDEAMKRTQIYKTAEGRAYLMAKEGDTHHGGCGCCGGDN